MAYQSNALWPAGVCSSKYGDDISTDTHETLEAALAVCHGLVREGFGGMKQHFPMMTWVGPIQDPPKAHEFMLSPLAVRTIQFANETKAAGYINSFSAVLCEVDGVRYLDAIVRAPHRVERVRVDINLSGE